MIADTKIEQIIPTFSIRPCDIIIESGRRFAIENATRVPPSRTPKKFIKPDHITAVLGFNELVYITVATAFAVS